MEKGGEEGERKEGGEEREEEQGKKEQKFRQFQCLRARRGPAVTNESCLSRRLSHSLTMNFIFPVPEASVPAVDSCSLRSAPGMIFSARVTR